MPTPRRTHVRQHPRRTRKGVTTVGAHTRNRSDGRIENLRKQGAAYEGARKAFDPRRYQRGGSYTPAEIETIRKAAGTRDLTNEERGEIEAYEWIHDPPDRAFLYYNESMTEVRSWMGATFGRITKKGPVVRRMGGQTQSVHVQGTNGVRYVGTCNLTGGNYCKLRKAKS